MKHLKIIWVVLIFISLTSCVSPPPRNVNDICQVFRQQPKWYAYALDAERRWRVPVAVQMAIVHQESKFDARARPARTKLLWAIPWKRPSTAYGYTQALKTTWRLYQKNQTGFWATRESFAYAVDFIGWYANQAYQRAGISRDDAYGLYLAYHEGVGGYINKSYLSKSWLLAVALKVNARAQIYQAQLASCKRRSASHFWF